MGGKEEDGGEGEEVRTKLEVTQEEISASSDEEDAQKREEEGGLLLTLTQEVLHIDEETKMGCNRKWMDHRIGVEEVVEVVVAARV